MIVSTKPTSRRSLRSHKKSRNGCQRCKERKVKCDEQRPICRTCSRRFGSLEPCVFENAISPSTDKTSSNVSLSLQMQHPQPNYAITLQPESKVRRWELRLFHHFTTCMAVSMPNLGRSEIDNFWRIDVPRISFDSDAVLSVVLGLAATHSLSRGSKNIEMKRSAQFYQAKSASQLSTLVSKFNKWTAETVVIVALLLILQTRMRAIYMDDHEPYRLPLDYFYLHNGAEILIVKVASFVKEGSVLVVLGVQLPLNDLNPFYEEALLDRIMQDNLSLLEGTNVDGFDPQVKRHIEEALAYLNVLYMALLNKEDTQWTRRRSMAMPTHVSIGFVRLLEQHDPRAMAILARFMALMKPCDGIWYYQGCAEYEVEGIASLMPPDWLWAMEWPREILISDTLWDDFTTNCDETRHKQSLQVISGKHIVAGEDFLVRHRTNKICMGEQCHCFQDLEDDELKPQQYQ